MQAVLSEPDFVSWTEVDETNEQRGSGKLGKNNTEKRECRKYCKYTEKEKNKSRAVGEVLLLLLFSLSARLIYRSHAR